MMHTRPVIPPMPNREASGPFAVHPNLAAKHEAAWATVMHAHHGRERPPAPDPVEMSEAARQRQIEGAKRAAAARAVNSRTTLLSAVGPDEWLTVVEIAARLGIGATAARARLARARAEGWAERSGRTHSRHNYRWRIIHA